jgi:tRNA pseudouridine55 synthase
MKENKYIVPVFKPKGPTSHDIIDQIRKATGVKKVGHAGTLDPLASGVLVVGITRKGTKCLYDHVKKEKEYVAEICLGAVSKTCDQEGPIEEVEVKEIPAQEQVEKVLSKWQGKVMQRPPKYSAVKINGTPAYKLARQGKEFELPERVVEIKKIDLVNYSYPDLKIRFVTGKGVYIRSLARDIGEDLGTGGYLKDLKRTRVGQYGIDDCVEIGELCAFVKTAAA